MAEGNDKSGAGKRLTMATAALVSVIALVLVVIVMSMPVHDQGPGDHADDITGGDKDEGTGTIVPTDNTSGFISDNNTMLAIGLDELPAGWDVNISYFFRYSDPEINLTEDSGSNYRWGKLGDDSFQSLSVFIIRFDSVDAADRYYDQTYGVEGGDHWQGVDIETVGPVDVGDEAMLCSGNWSWSKAAIKTVMFRQNNVLCFIVYEAAWQYGLTNDEVIEMAKLQDAKLIEHSV